jgi:hypothetical protein
MRFWPKGSFTVRIRIRRYMFSRHFNIESCFSGYISGLATLFICKFIE